MAQTDGFAARIQALTEQLASNGVSAMLITPGTDLSYLTGYHAVPLERITTLVISPNHDPFMLVPRLEKSAALASPFGSTGFPVLTWGENDNPYTIIEHHLGPLTGTIAVDSHMWAERLLNIQEYFPSATCIAGSGFISELRTRKNPAELDHLREAARAIDRVHARVPEILRVGRSEREVASDIADLILTEGHVRVDFVIVASGPNGASPHHEVSDRIIEKGDPVVVDIGGTMPSGYCSDCTRTYSMGAPNADFLERYLVLQRAQELSTKAVHVGAVSHDIDAAGREELTLHGLGEYFIHRTGHGIGLDTHEEPYIGINNTTVIEEDMVFSIEPGFYIEGVHGARIEDIVICTTEGPESINKQTRDLVIVEG